MISFISQQYLYLTPNGCLFIYKSIRLWFDSKVTKKTKDCDEKNLAIKPDRTSKYSAVWDQTNMSIDTQHLSLTIHLKHIFTNDLNLNVWEMLFNLLFLNK